MCMIHNQGFDQTAHVNAQDLNVTNVMLSRAIALTCVFFMISHLSQENS